MTLLRLGFGIGSLGVVWLGSAPVLAQTARQAPFSGEVTAVRTGEDIAYVGETDRIPLIVSEKLKAGDVLRTNASGSLALVFADQTQMRLGRNTTLTVKAVEAGIPSEVDVAHGRVWARSPRGRTQLSARTPSATAAIRGTEWALNVTSDRTELSVVEGEVDFFNAQGRLSITGGEAAEATPTTAPVRIVLVNRGRREQMIYSLPPDFGQGETGLMGQAYAEARAGDFPAALQTLDRHDRQNPDDPAYYRLKARIGLLLGQEAEIESALSDGLSRKPDDPDLRLMQAEYLADYKGQTDQAIARLEDQPMESPDRALLLARFYLERRRPLAARDMMDRALRTDPDRADLLARSAEVYLALNRLVSATDAAQRALSLSPGFPEARLVLGQIAVLRAQPGIAQTEFLASSSANPGYALPQLRLAEIQGRARDADLAAQQTDAADRLDPLDPRIPLYRSALALDQFRGRAAIDAAQESLDRFQYRGGQYQNLSESRENGSTIARAYRFQGLEEWGRYYGDRTYDGFLSTSYFDQTLNETPGPFFIRSRDTSFDPASGNDLEQVSSYIQGLLIDPLSIGLSEQAFQISQDRFHEGRVVLEGLTSDITEFGRIRLGYDWRDYLKHSDGSETLPVSVSIRGAVTQIDDSSPRQSGDRRFLESYLGAELTPRLSATAFLSHRGAETDVFTSRDILIVPDNGDSIRTEEELSSGFAFLNYELSDREQVTVGGGYTADSISDATRFVGFDPVTPLSISQRSEERESWLGFARYHREFGRGDLKLGVEHTNSLETATFSRWNQPRMTSQPQSFRFVSPQETDLTETRLYGDYRIDVTDRVSLQGQLSHTVRGDQNPSASGTDFSLGAAFASAPGHWVRGAYIEQDSRAVQLTLAPITVLGLKPSLAPVDPGERSDALIGRWDAEWSDWLFTSVEYQDRTLGRLSYFTPDGAERVGGVTAGELDQLSVAANILPGGNWALSAEMRWVDTEITEGGDLGGRIPFVPRSTASVEAIWTHPKRLKARLIARYTGDQQDTAVPPIDEPFNTVVGSFVTVDAFLEWEPFDRHAVLKIGVINALDNQHEVTLGLPAPGRALFGSIGARF